jgi:hypothetical protein
MVKDGADIQAYTAQIEVDAAHQVIIAQGVSGYFSQHNAEHLQQRNLDPYIAVGRDGTAAALPTQASTPAQRLKASMGEKLSKGKGKLFTLGASHSAGMGRSDASGRLSAVRTTC